MRIAVFMYSDLRSFVQGLTMLMVVMMTVVSALMILILEARATVLGILASSFPAIIGLAYTSLVLPQPLSGLPLVAPVNDVVFTTIVYVTAMLVLLALRDEDYIST